MHTPQAKNNSTSSIVDLLSHRAFEDVQRLASFICNTPPDLITVVDIHLQQFSAPQWTPTPLHSLEKLLCAHLLENPAAPLFIEDLSTDYRYASKTTEPQLLDYKFYTLLPLESPQNQLLGVLCIRDYHAKVLDDSQLAALHALANQTTRHLQLDKKEEQPLRLLESIVTNTKDAVIITEASSSKDTAPCITYVNRAFTELTGYTAKEILGKSPHFLYGPKTASTALKNLSNAIQQWDAYETTLLNYKKNGEEFWGNISLSPVANENGRYTHWITILRDMSDQKNLEFQKKLLASISMFFQKKDSLKYCLEEVLKHLVDITNFNLGEIWLPNSANSQLSMAAKFADKEAGARFYENSSSINSFEYGIGLPGTVWKNSALEVWDKIDTKVAFIRRTAAEKSGIDTVMGLPLLQNNQCIGVLVLGSVKVAYNQRFYGQLFKALESHLGAEIQRKRLEIELDQIFNFAPDIIAVVGEDGYFKKVNPAAVRLLGYSEVELLNRPFWEFIHPDDHSLAKRQMESLQQGRLLSNSENRYITKNGSVKWISWTATQAPEEGLFYCIGKDVTENKELQQRLDKANTLAGIGSWEWDLVHQKMYWSNITKEISEVGIDYPPSPAASLLFLKSNSAKRQLLSLIWNAIHRRKAFDEEILMLTANGKEQWVRLMGKAEFEGEKCIRISGSIQHIHKLKTALVALNTAFKEKDEILKSIGDAFISVDRQWTVTYWNKKAEELLEMDRSQTIGKDLWTLYRNITEAEIFPKYQQAMETGQSLSFQEHFPTLDKWFDVSVYPSEQGLSLFIKDVSRRKKIEAELRQSKERFEKVTQATQDAIWDWDIVKDRTYRGFGFKRLFGHTPPAKQGTLEFWKSMVHPEDVARVMAGLSRCIEDHSKQYWQAEYRFLKADQSYAEVLDMGMIIRDKNGQPTRVVGAMADISYRKTYEKSLKSLNESLEKHAKDLEVSNAELEQFAYIASHDLQEPLRMVTSFLSQLEKKYKDQLDAKAHQYIYFAVDGAKRMRQIILDLLDFSRVGRHEDEKEAIDLNVLIEDFKVLRRKLIVEKSAQITYDPLPIVTNFKAPLIQAFHNLLDNALKYTDVQQAPRIHIGVEDQDTHWQFSVQDNGIGIEGKFFEKIFVIFQRLHHEEEYSGTGMGLAIVKKIVENLGGKIWLHSERGKGTTFYFTIKKHQ
ncbi:PAS domain S-box protein [Arenibacter sp. 6A1]|uniref:PAS domain S-box protein n=1 Tax=Arenibacter sp. 6A1 TaxID=2720391 RepID=UPI001444CAF1|nr:PAS domain S-box protein [Arenibacter sp. 6A1]NKI25737.1 PAS domain S-box protein [Arenibacter sp. 6A1]